MRAEIESFTTVARDFCTLLETATKLELDELRKRLLHILPTLYLAATKLPNLDVDADLEQIPLKLDPLVALQEHLGDNDT